jgi:hypothetical protein
VGSQTLLYPIFIQPFYIKNSTPTQFTRIWIRRYINK